MDKRQDLLPRPLLDASHIALDGLPELAPAHGRPCSMRASFFLASSLSQPRNMSFVPSPFSPPSPSPSLYHTPATPGYSQPLQQPQHTNQGLYLHQPPPQPPQQAQQHARQQSKRGAAARRQPAEATKPKPRSRKRNAAASSTSGRWCMAGNATQFTSLSPSFICPLT